jgi:hypothetical protein
MLKTYDTQADAEHALWRRGYRLQPSGKYWVEGFHATIHPIDGTDRVRVMVTLTN